MKEAPIIGLDLAKQVFRRHKATAKGGVVFRRKLRRHQALSFPGRLPHCGMVPRGPGQRGIVEIAPWHHRTGLTRALAQLTPGLNGPQATEQRLAAEMPVRDVRAQAVIHYGRTELRLPGREPAAIRAMPGPIAAEAALAAGFGDQAYLIRLIHRHCGMVPAALIRH